MTIDHVAIWTNNLERLKDYYIRYFNGCSNEKYVNYESGFESYFISFESGARIEIMKKANIPDNLNDRINKQHLGIIHLAFGAENIGLVNEKATELETAGFQILRGPRKTGDGYWEFETLDPDNNRIEVATRYQENTI
jgi:lactoylglutathione lyase